MDTDARVSDGEMDLVAAGAFARSVADPPRIDPQHDFPVLGELHGVVQEVQEDLSQPGEVADDGRGRLWVDDVCEVERLVRRGVRHELEGGLDAFSQAEGLMLQVEPPGLDLREVEDLVDHG
jgi:hypothetical protein